MVDFQELRKEYETHGIHEKDLGSNPLAVFRNWFEDAAANCPVKWFEINAMTLSTADLSGAVTSRVVLLKGIDADSIRFYTNYDSSKGKQLAANPQAAVNFHWPWLGRQVRIRGAIEKTSREDSLTYFRSRPRGSQIGALASQQSCEIDSPDVLKAAVSEIESKYADQEIPLPENWGGYRLKPDYYEFWQGRLNRLHDRVVYQPEGESWNWKRLSP